MPRPRLELLEARVTPAFPAFIPDGAALVPAGTGLHRVINPLDGTDLGDLRPFPDGFAGEVRAATADVTGDGYLDLVVAAGAGGGPRVRVFDGRTGDVVRDFLAFEPDFRGGVYVAAGSVNRDGHADLVVGAGEGGAPRVRVFDGATGGCLADFFAFEPDFRGGVRVAAGDLDGDGLDAEVVAGAGPGGAPRVAVYAVGPGVTGVASFLAYDPGLSAGVSVAVAGPRFGFTGAAFGLVPRKVVTAPGGGGGPHVKVFDGTTGAEEASYLAGDPASRAGLRVTGTAFGVLAEAPTPAGPALRLGPLSGGEVYWTLPPGAVRVAGSVAAVAADGSSLTLSAAGVEPRVIPVRADAVVRRVFTWEQFRLQDAQFGDRASVLLDQGGAAVEVLVTSPPPPTPPVFAGPTPLPPPGL